MCLFNPQRKEYERNNNAVSFCNVNNKVTELKVETDCHIYLSHTDQKLGDAFENAIELLFCLASEAPLKFVNYETQFTLCGCCVCVRECVSVCFPQVNALAPVNKLNQVYST